MILIIWHVKKKKNCNHLFEHIYNKIWSEEIFPLGGKKKA